jgi:hypothetical protein
MLTSALRRALTLAVLLVAGILNRPELMIAQSSFEASGRITPSTGEADFFTNANRAGLFSTGAFPGISGTGLGIRAFGRAQTPSTVVTKDLIFNPVTWNRWSGPSQPWISNYQFGDFSTGSFGLTGIGRQQGGGFDPFAERDQGRSHAVFPTLFPAIGALPRNQVGGTSAGTLPRFDARISSAFTVPLNSSADALRLSGRDIFRDGRNAGSGDSGSGSGSAIFGASNLGNGVFLSAGSSFGSRAAAGSPAGNSASTGQKHSGPSVGLKLTF